MGSSVQFRKPAQDTPRGCGGFHSERSISVRNRYLCFWVVALAFHCPVESKAQSPADPSEVDRAAEVAAERLKRLDRNADGKVSRDELPPRNADRMMQRADTNRDGMIDADEVKRLAALLGRRAPAQLKVGQPAPDFDLPVLELMVDAEGKSTYGLTGDTIQLSALRGRKVVCVFLTSYT
ncbi:MAG TPA: hypothetical protein DD670_20945 [Planctomycetaceae bacterium]|nr:hypothetical protein [Planctomycetaceae bacterium]